MKLTFKDLKQQKFVIEAEPSELISDIKAKIEAEKGWEPGLQKLIYSGKILQDGNTVESYSIEEKGFIVCMVTKPKASAASSSKAQPSTPATTAARTPGAPGPAAPTLSATSDAPNTPSPAAPAGDSAGASTNSGDPTGITMGSERDAAIARIEGMGFDRENIERAMRAAFNNPDRAVEYLLTGIPENQEERQPQPSARQPQQAATRDATAVEAAEETAPAPDTGEEPVNLFEAAAQAGQGGRGAGGASGAGGQGAGTTEGGRSAAAALGNLEFLRNNREFQQLRQVVHQQPQMLEPILQQVAAGNPGLARMITTNPEQFMDLLSEDMGEEAPLPPGAQTISVTEEERDAIDRLCRLGFERDLVIQAYFACDKDEELAANFLFEQPEDDDNQ